MPAWAHKQEGWRKKKTQSFNHAQLFKRHIKEFYIQSKAASTSHRSAGAGGGEDLAPHCSSRSVQMVGLRVDCILELGD